jgi:hypothetical protein
MSGVVMTIRFPRVRPRAVCITLVTLLFVIGITAGRWLHRRYAIEPEMKIPIKEFSTAEYPEDPADRSVHFGKYNGRTLQLVQKDDTRFDFIFLPQHEHTATVIFRDVDVSLLTPGEPEWTKQDPHLERIALTDRQWNRQQVSFRRESPHIEVSGGNGFEVEDLYEAKLAKNCLNAGLWEVMLTVSEHGGKACYYHGWFTFPLGQYKRLFEHNTGLAYWKHWYKLEHWSDPVGTPVQLDGLREVIRERDVAARFATDEPVIFAGEQVRKRRTVDAENILAWRDFFDGRKVQFATFTPPGRYDVRRPWHNEFERLSCFVGAVHRDIRSPAQSEPLQELELIFQDRQTHELSRFIVSGFNASALPQLPQDSYPDGLYMPMGIGVPPFFQSYDELVQNPPHRSPYFCVLLDSQDRWINHHDVAIDGPVIHRDENDPTILHVYLLSYERHSLIGHYIVCTGDSPARMASR